MKLNKSIVAGLTAGALLGSAALADETVVMVGATAFRAIAQNRLATAGVMFDVAPTVTTGTDSNFKRYVGPMAPYGTVTVYLSTQGSANGMNAVRNGTLVPIVIGAGANAGTAKAHMAFSDVFPATASITTHSFDDVIVGVTPFILGISDAASSTDMSGVVNLTQRQTTFLFETSGIGTTDLLGGAANGNPYYIIGRDTGSGSRLCVDACTYFGSSPANYWSNSVTHVVELNPTGGYDSGAKVAVDVKAIKNSIGYMSIPDSAGLRQIKYNGNSFSDANVQNGVYELWGYEHTVRNTTTATGGIVPSNNELAIINKLRTKISDNTYQTTDINYVNIFVPLAGMNCSRTTDGGPLSF